MKIRNYKSSILPLIDNFQKIFISTKTHYKLTHKTKLLLIGLGMDLVGYASYAVLGVGEWFDVVWAPLAAYVFYRLYPGTEGKVGSLITFAEEALPMTDIIPTFTLMWFYTFVIKKKKNS